MVKEVNVAGTVIEVNGKILILLRHPEKPSGNLWGFPSGKVDKHSKNINKDYLDTAIRETFQETGYRAKPTQLKVIGDYIFSFPGLKVNYRVFKLNLDNPFRVRLSPEEHSSHRGITPQECYSLPNLILGV